MTSEEAEKNVNSLKSGELYEFSHQYDGTREVIEYNRKLNCFTFTTYYAYGDTDKEITEYSEDIRKGMDKEW